MRTIQTTPGGIATNAYQTIEHIEAAQTPAFDLQTVDGETRILDVDLARRLGFDRPRKIRDLIQRHVAALERMGTCPAVGRVVRGNETKEFRLNRKQAIFITAKSETAEATEITIEIIERFEAYERKASQIDPMVALNDPNFLRGLLASYSDKMIALEATNAALAPKADALDRIATADGSMCMRDAAKTLQVRPKDLVDYLSQHGWIYKRPGTAHWVAYQEHLQRGDLEHKVTTVLRGDGSEKITEQVRVTAKGLTKLAKLMPGRLSVVAGATA